MALLLEQLPFKQLCAQGSIDLFLIALGHESRASYLASVLNSNNIQSKYCIELVDDMNQKEKERISEMGFLFIKRSELKNILASSYGTVVVDYSVMMKSLYAEIIMNFYNSDALKNTKFYFSYTHAVFEKAVAKSRYVESIKPILLTDDKLIVDNNKAKLIISLGYERLSAIGVIENLEISYDDVIIFINKESDASKHYHECLRVNKEFLELIDPSNIIEINFYNPDQLGAVVDAILFRLSQQKYRVIISPMSVKTFSLYAMVCSLRYNNVVFYNVTSLNVKPHYEKQADPARPPLVYRITMADLKEQTRILPV